MVLGSLPNDVTTWAVILFFGVALVSALVYLGAKMPLFWTIAKFGYSNAIYNSRINKFVRKMYLDNLLNSHNLSEAVNFAASTSSRDLPLKTVTSAEEAERTLHNVLRERIEEAVEESPKKFSPVLRTFIIRHENRVLKALFRNFFFDVEKRDDGAYPVGSVDERTIENMANAGSPEEISEAVPGEERRAELIQGQPESHRDAEYILDRHYIRAVEDSARKLPRAVRKGVRELLQVHIDILNLKNVMRLVRSEIPGKERGEYVFFGKGKNIDDELMEKVIEAEGIERVVEDLEKTPYGALFREIYSDYKETKRLSVFELELDRFWLKYVENFGSKMNTTVGPVMRYLLELEMEIRNVMAVLRAKEIPDGREIAEDILVYREA